MVNALSAVAFLHLEPVGPPAFCAVARSELFLAAHGRGFLQLPGPEA